MRTLEAARRSATIVAGALLVLITGTAQAQTPLPAHDFTIAEALSAPLPGGMVAAPKGGRAAWVYNAAGVRNVWVAEPKAGGALGGRALTTYIGDDGEDLGELAWDAAGETVFYSRGGSLEGGGPVNIMSRPSGAEPQKVWAVGLDGGAPRLIGPGHGAAPSPKGDVVAYIQAGQVFVAAVKEAGAPKPLIQIRGEIVGIVWSPDGSRLAFVSNRGDHVLIGVYDQASRTITWMAPSTDTDGAPEWSPDGRRLAFVRTPATTPSAFVAQREGRPWAIWVADPATGAGRAVWTADAGRGSVFHAALSDRVLYWGKGDRLVFPWEKTGWLNLYSVPATGGEAQNLTPGAFEVFNLALTPGGGDMVYSANGADTDRYHLWRVPIDGGGPPRALTRGDGIEDYPVVTSDGAVLGLHSDARNALRPVTVETSGALDDVAPGAIPASFPVAKFVQPTAVTFTAADGQIVHGQLFLPPHRRPGAGPALLFFHGGPIRQMLVGWHPMDAYNFMYAMNQYLANEGYVVLSVNYRGGIGYGLDYREALNFGPDGASEYNDIVGGANVLRARKDVDPARVGIWGGSYGGLMTALGLSRASNLLAAGVDYAGVHDWRKMLPFLDAPEAAKGAAERAYASSAIATADQWRSPVLFVHADDDRNVPFAQTVEMVEALRKHEVPIEQIVIPDEIHDLLRRKSWMTYFNATDAFFARTLGAP